MKKVNMWLLLKNTRGFWINKGRKCREISDGWDLLLEAVIRNFLITQKREFMSQWHRKSVLG
jgi:hypothetical protein